ncbi:MAG TPA: hypothetical protein VJN01_08220 [Xanthomonadales bacterium]|nr:hypothetical protein [Xanthomonadales bacterium]
MITLRKKYRLKISNRLAATAAVLLLMSSVVDPLSLMPAPQSGALADVQATGPAQQQESSTLEDAVSGIASAVSQSGAGSLKISSLIFRF